MFQSIQNFFNRIWKTKEQSSEEEQEYLVSSSSEDIEMNKITDKEQSLEEHIEKDNSIDELVKIPEKGNPLNDSLVLREKSDYIDSDYYRWMGMDITLRNEILRIKSKCLDYFYIDPNENDKFIDEMNIDGYIKTKRRFILKYKILERCPSKETLIKDSIDEYFH